MKSEKFRLTAGIISACLAVLALGGCGHMYWNAYEFIKRSESEKVRH